MAAAAAVVKEKQGANHRAVLVSIAWIEDSIERGGRTVLGLDHYEDWVGGALP